MTESSPKLAEEFSGTSRVYVVSGNPFGIIYILPALIINILIVQLLIDFNVDVHQIAVIFIALSFVILAVPALSLRGNITYTDAGINLNIGAKTINVAWSEVEGLVHDSRYGLSLVANTKLPAQRSVTGVRIKNGKLRVPLRIFGDRRFAMFYEVRDHLPERTWMDILKVRPIESRYPALIYGLAVLVCVGGIIAVAYFVD